MPHPAEDERNKDKSQNISEFIKNNWPKAMALAGAAGLVGAVIWLTARFLREEKSRDDIQEKALIQAEIEAQSYSDATAMMLETGSFLGEAVGEDAGRAAQELADQIDDKQIKEALETLSSVTKYIGRSGR
jgi:hypothetical protein